MPDLAAPASADRSQEQGTGTPILEVRELRKWYPISRGLFGRGTSHVKAVDGVSFTIGRGQTVGLVGESGCGKTTTGKVVLRLEEPTSGSVLFEGRDIFRQTARELRRTRRDMQIVFQDPYSSLNPRKNVAQIVGEPLVIHGVRNRHQRMARVRELLGIVGLTRDQADRYPHEFSGGQRQRIGIARALAVNPKLVVLDEPVSALDVSIQSQVLNLLEDLQHDFGLAYLFIAHDLSVVQHISDQVGVMYLGKLVELATARQLFANPLHPYTQALISAVPATDPDRRQQRILLEGDVPSPVEPPKGCRFHTRCPYALEHCVAIEPALAAHGAGHAVACHLHTDPGHHEQEGPA